MKTLSLQETVRHLKDLASNAPRLFEKQTEAAAFTSHCTQLLRLLDEHRSAELPVSIIRDTLFPNATGDSSRVLFANFRKTLSAAAGRDGRDFSLVQPDLRGRDASTVTCHFTGSSVSLQPDMDDITRRAVAGRGNETLIQAPAAFVTGEFYERLLLHFTDPQTSARLPVRFFLSYAHKNTKLKDKLLDALRDELAISRRFDFSIWEDKGILVGNEWHREIQTALAECDLCLSLLSPAFLASNYIVQHEIPPIVAREIPAIPVELEPLDLKRHNTRGLEDLQIFTPAFSKCTGNTSQKEFARKLAHKIEEKVAEEALAIAQRFAADYLGEKRAARDLAGHHPELMEILSGGESAPFVSPENMPSASEAPAKLRINSLLTGCLKSLPSNLITPYAATGDLESVTREIARQSANDDAPDPYLIFQRHQRNAVDYLAIWAQDPGGSPFAAVLGEIGSGKTTTLQMLAQRLAKDTAAPPIIFIDLREYFDPSPPTLEGILADHLRRYDPEKKLTVNELIDAVRTQRGVIVFDGLDEKIISLAEAARQNFIRELWRVLPPEIMDKPAESGRGKLIISCRSHYFPNVQAMGSGYVANDRSKVKTRDYLACVMLPWKDEQIREYLLELLGEKRVDTALDLIVAVHNLKDLASRPYLISLIGPELEELEKDRAEGRTINAASLYRKFIERWLHRDDGKHVFTPAHKLRLMESLAAALWRENARTWPWERVEEWLETFLHENPVIASALAGQPIAVLQQDFRTATFFLRPDACAESFRFVHTSLQEYFLACHLARTLEKSYFVAWELPEPSRETFDFLGQHLLVLSSQARNRALKSLSFILGAGEQPNQTRRNALRFYTIAVDYDLPISEAPALEASELYLKGWKFHGKAERLLTFGPTSFNKANLDSASFEYVHFISGADFQNADLPSSRFYACTLATADFRNSCLDGAFFRQCDLTGVLVPKKPISKKGGKKKPPILAHLCRESPWPSAPFPSNPSASIIAIRGSFIGSAEFSPDGNQILSPSQDHSVRLWDAKTGACLQSLSGHSATVSYASFSPDGRFIVTASHDKTVRIWDAVKGSCVQTLKGHTSSVASSSFSPDGKLVVSASHDDTLRIWEPTSGSCLRIIKGHFHLIASAVFCSDGTLICGKDVFGKNHWCDLNGTPVAEPERKENWPDNRRTTPTGLRVLAQSDGLLVVRDQDLIIREILPLPSGQCIVREPWDEEETRKPYHEIRWKFTHGPKDAWRWCHVVDTETGAIHPPELAAVPGAFSGPEVGPL
jgi:uncharacterized protein YjbI with pentapeptide repeats